jgi:carbamoyltransferase
VGHRVPAWARGRPQILRELRWPDSLGLLYSAFTYYTGFKVNSGEYKVMGLAPYGEPKYVDLIYKHLVDLREDGSFTLEPEVLQLSRAAHDDERRLRRAVRRPAARPETNLTQKEMDLARSVQVVTEEIMLRMARRCTRRRAREPLPRGRRRAQLRRQRRLLREGRSSTLDPARRRRRRRRARRRAARLAPLLQASAQGHAGTDT